MKKLTAILLLLSLLLTPAWAEGDEADLAAAEAEILKLAALPPMMLQFTETETVYYLADGTPTDMPPMGEAVEYTDAAGNQWRTEFYDEAGNLTGCLCRHYEVALVPSTVEPANSDEAYAAREAVPQPRSKAVPEYVRTSHREYDENGLLQYHTETAYDNLGRETQVLRYDSDGKVTGRSKYSYPAENAERVEYYGNDDTPDSIRESRYDEQGREVYSYAWEPLRLMQQITRTYATYDENGNLCSKVQCNDDGTVRIRWEYSYDDEGNEIGHLRILGDGSLRTFEMREYDEAGRLIIHDTYNWDRERKITTYTYNDAGLLSLAQTVDEDGDLISQTTYTDFGQPLRTEYYKSNGGVARYVDYVYVGETLRYTAEYRRGKLSHTQTYDTAGNVVRGLYMDRESLSSWNETVYSSDGYRAQSITRNPDGSMARWRIDLHTPQQLFVQWMDWSSSSDAIYRQDNEPANAKDNVNRLSWDGDVLRKTTSHVFTTHDEAGNILASYYYHGNTLGHYTVNTWAPTASMPTAVTGPAEPPTLVQTLTLDAQGREIARQEHRSNDAHVEFEYDEMGNVTQERRYNAHGVLTDRIECSYNRAGNLLSRFEYTGNGSFVSGREYDYDADGNRILEKQYLTEDRTGHWYVSKFNEAGNMISQTDYFSDGETIRSRTTWHYSEFDSDFLHKEVRTNYEDGEPVSRTEYRYNSHGEVTYQGRFAVDGETETAGEIREWERKYEDERPVYAALRIDGVLRSEQRWEYDAANRLTTTQITENGEIRYELRSTYDSAGKLLRQSIYDCYEGMHWDGRPFISDRRFSYDEAGNLIFAQELTGNGIRLTAYGAYGNILWEQQLDAHGEVTQRFDYFYDENGKLTQERDHSGAATCFNPDGTVARITHADGSQTVYVYE